MITNPALGPMGNAGLSGYRFFNNFISAAITAALIIGSLIFFFNLITGAIYWISSGGDKEAVGVARKKISNALVGIIILFAMFAVLALIEYFFNIKILTLDMNSLVIQ